MVLLGDEAQVEARFALFGYSANLDGRSVHGLRRTYPWLENHFGRTRLYTYVTKIKWKHFLVCLEIVLILTPDWCMVCAEHSVGSEIILETPDRTPR